MLVVTEFGRTAAVNGTGGTDHGTGGVAFLPGGGVRGGRIAGDWPGIERKPISTRAAICVPPPIFVRCSRAY